MELFISKVSITINLNSFQKYHYKLTISHLFTGPLVYCTDDKDYTDIGELVNWLIGKSVNCKLPTENCQLVRFAGDCTDDKDYTDIGELVNWLIVESVNCKLPTENCELVRFAGDCTIPVVRVVTKH